ncbi:hypothetical protein H072_7586 [Dactylellina haptotyla CBS 200.50]|uniref:DUF7708 domain-containing protein n=1 Tax=Dactylellina haptotyla (strain CBS 200.50) TaxID=1284197 RepID=S8BH16_DACHA|nr:hypothetical protein H072_7586 [Dactylellina haptotyla CBS 200.50]
MSAVSASILSSQLGPFEEALWSFSAKLTHSQRTQFTSTTQQDVEILAAKLQHEQEGRKGYRAMGLLRPFIDGLVGYSKVIEVFAQTSEILAFVWGPIKFLIQVTSKWHGTMDKLMDALAAVGDKLLIYEKCNPIVREDLRFKKVLVRVYTDILDLLWTALRIFGKNTVKQFLEIQSPVFDKKLTGVLSNLSNDEDLIRDAVSVTTLNQTIKFHQKAEEEFRAAAKQRMYTTLQLFRQELQPALISSSRLEGAKKISSKYPGAGSWLANHPNSYHGEISDPMREY